MDFIKSQLNKAQTSQTAGDTQAHGEQAGGLMGKLNNAMGGGHSGEKKEDALDKAVDYVQEHFMGAGPQNNESAVEQAKDEQISDAIRRGYKSATGKEFPISDK
ncbi:hypothetical protein CYLTODRAFT_446649 [Cylindrobasidium torrendii FP15055 ss-10]|uniref:DNA damage-responsive protein 48 n=1 Tax=Cylindrobasidium torrendii FP15055 ss-10 TaxID=1314674 RepID=A0A0D7AYU4_9AGAR|nr:hypothetical protein CYLTODRAFT_446649 [Cylindrobasidium torrendii FP15055 ss-10]